MLVIFSGLPAVGKTTMARELARQIGAAHLRIDSIEQAIRGSATGTQPFDELPTAWLMLSPKIISALAEP